MHSTSGRRLEFRLHCLELGGHQFFRAVKAFFPQGHYVINPLVAGRELMKPKWRVCSQVLTAPHSSRFRILVVEN